MPKLWSDGFDYNESVKHRPQSWKTMSRRNHYVFVYNNQKREISDVVLDYRVCSILDYGCGHSFSIEHTLKKHKMPFIQVERYDPFVDEWKARPTKTYDLVVSHNVLGGVEREYAVNVIEDTYSYANKVVMFKIPAMNGSFYIETFERLYGNQIKEFSITSMKELRKFIPNARDIPVNETDEELKFLYFLIEKSYAKEHES